MDFLFEVLFEIFPRSMLAGRSKFFKVSFYILTQLVVTGQNIQLIWYPGMTMTYWSVYESFWNTINITALDVAAARLSLLYWFAIFEFIAFSTILFILLLIIILKVFKRRIPELILSIVRCLLIITCEVLIIPTWTICFVIYKYSGWTSEDIKNLYPNSASNKEADFGNTGKCLSMLILPISVILIFFYEASNFQVRFSKTDEFCDSKINPKPDLIIKLVYIINTYLMIELQLVNYRLFLIVSAGLYSFSAFSLIYHIPYYSPALNALKFGAQLECASISIFFFIGLSIDDAQVLFLLSVFMQPVILYSSYEIVKYRYLIIKPASMTKRKQFEKYERSIRPQLTSGKLGGKFIVKMNKNYSFNLSKLNIIIQSYYCHDMLSNVTLGFNKIFSISHKGLNVLINYQIYKCKRILEGHCKNSSDTYKLYSYFQNFKTAKLLDQDFCHIYTQFINKILDNNLKFKTLSTVIIELITKQKILRESYQSLLIQFPMSTDVKNAYGSLLLNILNDPKHAALILTKYGLSESSRDKGFLISAIPYAIISGGRKSIGKVTYFNKSFLDFFSYTEETAKELNIADIVPRIFSKAHSSNLYRFIARSTNHLVFQNAVVTAIDACGYIKECIVDITCITMEGSVNFVCNFVPLNNFRREFAFVSKHGFIFEHSRGFTDCLYSKMKNISETNIQELLDIDLTCIDINKVFELRFNLHNKDIDLDKNMTANLQAKCFDTKFADSCRFLTYGVFKEIQVNASTLLYLYVSNDQLEVKNWANPDDFFKVNENTDENFNIFSELQTNREKKLKKVSFAQSKFEEFGKKNKLEPNKSSSSSEYANVLSPKELRALKKSLSALSMMKILLLLLVIIIQVFVLILFAIGALIYISTYISSSKSFIASKNLKNLHFSLLKLSLFLRSKDLHIQTDSLLIFNESIFVDILSNSSVLMGDILNDYNQWSFCDSSSIVNSPSLPYWSFDNNPILLFGSLTTLTDFLIKNVSYIQANATNRLMNTGKDYKKSFYNVAINTMGDSNHYVTDSIQSIAQCEVENVEKMRGLKNYFIIIGFAVIILCVGILSIFLATIDTDLNVLYNLLKRSIQTQTDYIKGMINDRLTDFHNESQAHEPEVKSRNGHKEIKFRHSLRYFLKFSILFIVAFGFFLTIFLYFYANISNLLYYKPLISNSLSSYKNLLLELSFHTMELQSADIDIQLDPDFSNSKPNSILLIDLISNIKTQTDFLNSNEVKAVLSPKVYGYLFESFSSETILKAGAIEAINIIIFENLFLSFNNQNDEVTAIPHILYMDDKIFEAFEIIFTENREDMLNKIQEAFKQMIYFIVAYSFLMLSLYCFYYYPVIQDEISLIKSITDLIIIVPKHTEHIESEQVSLLSK